MKSNMSMTLLDMEQQFLVIFKDIQCHLTPMSALSKGREPILFYSHVSSMTEIPLDGSFFLITA